jgi:hypothetical protein
LRGQPIESVTGKRGVEPISLPFHNLAERHSGVTQAIGDCYTEAARVCLDRHHISPIAIVIHRPSSEAEISEATAEWEKTTERERYAWANEIEATEQGAYGFALAVVELEGLVAMRRAETRTGADYYISAPGDAADDLESYIRLEVSGVDRGDEQSIRVRLRQKIEQAASGESSRPAVAAVVGFRARLVIMARAEEA